MPNRRKLLLAAGLSSCALPCVQAARQPKQPHVVVIGAGGAGLAAAAEAARCGALVTVLEKAKRSRWRYADLGWVLCSSRS